MGRWLFARRRSGNPADEPRVFDDPCSWLDAALDSARRSGAIPYVVEGFTEISDAVKRGHPVLVRRQRAQVAEQVEVFAEPEAARREAKVITFDPVTARFVIEDPARAEPVELTPKRLQRYLSDPERAAGVALA